MRHCLLPLGVALAVAAPPASAHHGVAGLGAASLAGPGAPIEQSSSATVPAGKVFAYVKVDHADWKTYTAATDDEADYSTFWMAGLGYGVTPWLSLYAFLPYHDKVDENDFCNTHGFKEDGVAERATGGDILYVMPGLRAYWESVSLALGVKLPAWTDLNEEDQQQGAEGKENYRVIFSVSALF